MIAESIYNCSATSKKMSWIKVKQNPHLYTSSFIKDILQQATAVCNKLFGKSK